MCTDLKISSISGVKTILTVLTEAFLPNIWCRMTIYVILGMHTCTCSVWSDLWMYNDETLAADPSACCWRKWKWYTAHLHITGLETQLTSEQCFMEHYIYLRDVEWIIAAWLQSKEKKNFSLIHPLIRWLCSSGGKSLWRFSTDYIRNPDWLYAEGRLLFFSPRAVACCLLKQPLSSEGYGHAYVDMYQYTPHEAWASHHTLILSL